jgi:hypothetical protein
MKAPRGAVRSAVKIANAKEPARIREKSVFEVENSRLAIGVFTRPLLDTEARSFRAAWESDPMPGFEDYEIGRERISFVAPPENVSIAWKSIDRLLAFATENVRKAS